MNSLLIKQEFKQTQKKEIKKLKKLFIKKIIELKIQKKNVHFIKNNILF